MGEIKSTLELVMERTKHLTFSEDDRNKQKKEEIQKHLRGLIQKFQDGFLTIDQFRQQLDGTEQTHSIQIKSLLASEILSKMEIGQDNRLLTVLLKDICGLNLSNLLKCDAEYHDKYYKTVGSRRLDILKMLSKKYKISGSSVEPNLESDMELNTAAIKIKAYYVSEYNKEKQRLADAAVQKYPSMHRLL